MHKRTWWIVIGLLLILPTVYAYDTPIEVHTYKDTFVMVRVYPAGDQLNLVESYLDMPVDADGIARFSHTSDHSLIDVVVYIKLVKNGKTEIYKRFENIQAGQTFTQDVFKDGDYPSDTAIDNATESTNETAVENNETIAGTESVTEETNNMTTSITGNAIEGNILGSMKSYYLIAAILVAGLIIGGLLFARKRMRSNGTLGMKSKEDTQKMYNSNPAPSSEQLSSETLDSLKAELQKTKERLQQTNSDLAKMRNQDRIAKLEQNIKAEEEELKKLQQEDSN